MAIRVLICPLCGFEFERPDTLCQHGCPMSQFCDLVRCPSCEYEFPESPKVLTWFKRLLRGVPGGACDPPHSDTTLQDLSPGDRAIVERFAGANAGRHNTLTVFGLIPGAEIRLIQKRPSFVIQIGETDLALDEEIAKQIIVRLDTERGDELQPKSA